MLFAFRDVLLWGGIDLTLEDLGEIERVTESNRLGDLAHVRVTLFDQNTGVVDANSVDILGDAESEILFEQRGNILFVVGEMQTDILAG